jgi:HPt (histidine-containing phosphotransfer) domain-containing protein
MKNWDYGEHVMTASNLLSVASLDLESLSRQSPGQEPAIIDADHLERMTLGDRALEREVLEIFVRQTIIMLERIAGAEPALAAACAHTLTGSARGIGAWRVAQAAEQLEQAAGRSGGQDLDQAVDRLRVATVEASAAISARLGQALRGS